MVSEQATDYSDLKRLIILFIVQEHQPQHTGKADEHGKKSGDSNLLLADYDQNKTNDKNYRFQN